ncbi:hypothetical protein KP509_29G019500 [Ceratopteris richardii]|uniref:RING-type domain-containing protein n=1 Tax=Ceratopteris richardii TaxID=49495 RepID=A0A8T2R713_CERRI|nr:hypothetical protein KP509_29G019500 [Ceratopteris richardii]
MADDPTPSSSASKSMPAQPQYVVDIDLNAPPPDQDPLESENYAAQMRDARMMEYETSGDENSDDSDEDEEFLDVDNMSYEELLALGERIGKQSRGLHPDIISALPCAIFVQKVEESESIICVICRYDIKDGESFLTLPCKHLYHSECIKSWLHVQKNCPICNAEVIP